MTSYKDLYLMLFGAMEDALEYLERREVPFAMARLISAQRTAEELVMEPGHHPGGNRIVRRRACSVALPEGS